VATRWLSLLIDKAYRANGRRWWGYALFRLGRREDADDALQDAMLRTMHANPNLGSDEEVVAYMWTVLRTTSIHSVRAHRLKLRPEPFDEHADAGRTEERTETPLDRLLAAEEDDHGEEMRRLADKYLKALPEPLRICVELHVLAEPPMRYREIAKKLGIGKSTVGDRVNKGIDLLAQAVAQDLDEKP